MVSSEVLDTQRVFLESHKIATESISGADNITVIYTTLNNNKKAHTNWPYRRRSFESIAMNKVRQTGVHIISKRKFKRTQCKIDVDYKITLQQNERKKKQTQK